MLTPTSDKNVLFEIHRIGGEESAVACDPGSGGKKKLALKILSTMCRTHLLYSTVLYFVFCLVFYLVLFLFSYQGADVVAAARNPVHRKLQGGRDPRPGS